MFCDGAFLIRTRVQRENEDEEKKNYRIIIIKMIEAPHRPEPESNTPHLHAAQQYCRKLILFQWSFVVNLMSHKFTVCFVCTTMVCFVCAHNARIIEDLQRQTSE